MIWNYSKLFVSDEDVDNLKIDKIYKQWSK